MTLVIGLFAAAAEARSPPAKRDCSKPGAGLGVSRIIEVDASNGPLYGSISTRTKELEFLGPKEVVLTFDDGPMSWITKSILDTLDAFCTKATFFSVGRMALAYPDSVKDILKRGHTLGGHTWSHPLNMRRYSLAKAADQIERGFSAIALAAGQPIAPFFRFPGLSDSDPMLKHLQDRGIATFTVDVVSNDSYIRSPAHLANYTMGKLSRRGRGIMLFHDIKPVTAKALPNILRRLKTGGYKVVHLRSAAPLKPIAKYNADLTKILTKRLAKKKGGKNNLVPFYGAVAPEKPDAVINGTPLEVTKLIPPARERKATSKRLHKGTSRTATRAQDKKITKKRYKYRRIRKPRRRRYRPPPPSPSFWF
ncbi:MAG: polysaccharide deacetylase family protein [Alphaproteobacteria bacterium]|nr:polysaccharide deacetylase family protein [Alphaproteobacteria bacterium]